MHPWPDLDPLIHQPVRMRVMALLHRNREASFKWLRDELGLTDGNLGSHATRLVDAGYLRQRRALTAAGFQVRYAITPEGDAALRTYLDALRAVMDAAAPADVARDPA